MSKKSRFDRWASEGVQQQLSRVTQVDSHEISLSKGKPVRENEGNPFVRQLLDPRLALEDHQRAAGTFYGASYEQKMCGGGGSEFLREFVDGGSTGSGGGNERFLHICNVVSCAESALRAAKPIEYPLGAARVIEGKDTPLRGPHRPIPQLGLVREVCANGQTLSAIALSQGWWVTRVSTKRGKKYSGTPEIRRVVPDRQRKRLAKELRDALDLVIEAWDRNSISVPLVFYRVKIER